MIGRAARQIPEMAAVRIAAVLGSLPTGLIEASYKSSLPTGLIEASYKNVTVHGIDCISNNPTP